MSKKFKLLNVFFCAISLALKTNGISPSINKEINISFLQSLGHNHTFYKLVSNTWTWTLSLCTYRAMYTRYMKTKFLTLCWQHVLVETFFSLFYGWTWFRQMSVTSTQISCQPFKTRSRYYFPPSLYVIPLSVFCLNKNIHVYANYFETVHFGTTKALIPLQTYYV